MLDNSAAAILIYDSCIGVAGMSVLFGYPARLGLLCAAATLLGGCTARVYRPVTAAAPGLNEDAPLSSRGGANPNAPYAELDHSVHLVRRPTGVDVSTAAPCAAEDLSLFESGARIDGEHRSVRLNLVNHAKSPCRLAGYPAITLLRPDGSLIGDIAIEKLTATTVDGSLHHAGAEAGPALSQPRPRTGPLIEPESVLLVPAGEASFEVGWTSRPNCDPVASIEVAAPDTVQSFTIRHAFTVCEGRIQVTAINDGTEL